MKIWHDIFVWRSVSKLLFLIFLFNVETSNAQCMLYEVPLSERITGSTVIIEGSVLQKTSYWKSNPNMIYTSYLVSVYKCFKGGYSSTEIEIVLEGGMVADKKIVLNPNLEIKIGEQGIFFLEKCAIRPVFNTGSSITYQAFAGPQGMIHYHSNQDIVASDPFNSYSDVQTELYDVIVAQLNHPYQLLQTSGSFNSGGGPPPPTPLAPSITSFTPTTLNAGTNDVLTINGTNFGASTGSVNFKNGDNGGGTYIVADPWHIVSWTNTQIQIKVPDGSGTGTIQVVDASAASTTSAGILTLNYDFINIDDGTDFQIPKRVNDNGSGGYTFVYNTTFNGSASAVASFERALSSWRCGTYVNFTRSGTSAISTAAGDGVNIVTFDGSAALPGGVLGRCTSYFTACGSGGWRWSVNELDVVMRTDGTGGITWNFGPGATAGGKYDFESVSVHELGHGHGLGHIIASTKVMHYAISANSDKRNLDATSDVAGGVAMVAFSAIAHPCGTGVMTALNSCNCPLNANPNGGVGTWTWTGAYSVNWFDICNWDVVSLPDGSSDVIIPGGTPFQPTITGATADCNSITINSSAGAVLNIVSTSSGVLNVNP